MSAYEIDSAEDDEAAFAAAYRAHSQKLLRYCQYRLRDRHEAEDVVQEAFVRAWRTMPVSGDRDRSFYPWLRVVAGNLCTDIQRKRSRSEPVAVIDPGAVDGEMDRITEESDRVLVRQALDRLNDRHRSALIMRESEGLSYDQIAARTGVSAGTVESLLWRARQALRREFTALAGRDGRLAVLPFLAPLVGRVRSSGHQALVRFARRSGALDPSQDAPLAHVVVAVVAAAAVVSGVAATLGLGGGPGGPSMRLHTVQTVPSALALPAGPALEVPPRPGTPGDAGSVPAASPGVTDGPAGPLSTGPGDAPAAPAPLRVVNPVAVGPSAARYAQSSPVTVHAAGLTVGASPPSVAAYTGSVTRRLATPIASTLNHALEENKP